MKAALVLSGGGARGFAHLGVLHALDEMKIRIDAISGTSAGAVAGAFYLSGRKPEEILRLILSYKMYQWARPTWLKPGFLSMDKIAQLFSQYLPANFEDLNRPQKENERNQRLPEEFLHNAQPDSFLSDSPHGSYQLLPAASPAGTS